MPAPTSAQIRGMADQAVKGAGLEGENISDLSGALADSAGQALTLFQSSAMMQPGAPAVVDPISTSGSTVGPGLIQPAPTASALQGFADGALAPLQGEDIPKLSAAWSGGMAQGFNLFVVSVMVSPGIPVAGMVTTAPGRFTGAVPQAGALEPIFLGLLNGEGLSGENIPDLASVLAEVWAGALDAFSKQVMVSPGIACTPAATAAPGMLV